MIHTHTTLFSLALYILLFLSACQRRDLTYDYEEGVPFRIELDWNHLESRDERPLYVKALFFPTDGGKVVERFVNPSGQEIKVPAGQYNIIVYTWRTNQEAQTVQFRGDTYGTFEAYTEEKYQRLPLHRSETSIPVVPQPDALYAWNSSMEPIEISYTRGVTPKSRNSSSHTLTAVMQPMIHHYEFEINVSNAEDINTMYAVLTEVYGSQPLGGGIRNQTRYGLLAQEVKKVSEAEGITTYRCSIQAFGFHDTNKDFILNITNTSGNGQQEVIDITQAIEDQDNGTAPSDEPIIVAPKEDPIRVVKSELGGGGGFIPPTLGDWEQKDENIDL